MIIEEFIDELNRGKIPDDMDKSDCDNIAKWLEMYLLEIEMRKSLLAELEIYKQAYEMACTKLRQGECLNNCPVRNSMECIKEVCSDTEDKFWELYFLQKARNT